METMNNMTKGFESMFSNWMNFTDKVFESVSTNPVMLKCFGQFWKGYSELQYRQMNYMKNLLEKMNIPTRNDISDMMELLKQVDSKITGLEFMMAEMKKEEKSVNTRQTKKQ